MNRQELIVHLRELGDGKNPHNPEFGLCSEIIIQNFGIIAECHKIMLHWPEGTGDNIYPIPHRKGSKNVYSAHMRYRQGMNNTDMWKKNAYGNRRRELCLYVAQELEK